MTRTSSQRSFGGANIKGTPPMSARQVRSDMRKLKRRLDIIGVQEFRHRWYWTVLLALLGSNWVTYPSRATVMARPEYGGQAIMWKERVFRKAAARVIKAFDFSKDHSGIMENRWFRAVLLEDRVSLLQCWYLSGHFVVHGDDRKEGPRRQAFMADNLERLDQLLTFCLASGEPAIFEGDLNIHTGTPAYFDLLRIVKKHGGRVVGEHGVEFLIVFPGLYTRVVVDRAYVLRPRDLGLHTDHEVRCIDHHLESKR